MESGIIEPLPGCGKRPRRSRNVAPLASLRRHHPDQVQGVLPQELSVRIMHTPSQCDYTTTARRCQKYARPACSAYDSPKSLGAPVDEGGLSFVVTIAS